MFDSASSFSALVGTAVDVVTLFMALLSFVESAPRAYRLKVSNAAPQFQHQAGQFRHSSRHAFAVFCCATASIGDATSPKSATDMIAAISFAILRPPPTKLQLSREHGHAKRYLRFRASRRCSRPLRPPLLTLAFSSHPVGAPTLLDAHVHAVWQYDGP